MKRVKVAAVAATVLLASATMLGATPSLAGPPDEREVIEMLQKSGMMRQDGMVSKQDFMKMMEKRFEMMDKQKKGMLSAKEIAKILDPNFATP
jgi:Spy/CpxP family protein refolding chaperone